MSDIAGWNKGTNEEYRRDREPSDARIQAQLGFMTEQVSIAHKIFAELTNRIDPVLLPEMDDVSAILESPERKAASEISNHLDDLNSQICRLQGRMNRVLERVQL